MTIQSGTWRTAYYTKAMKIIQAFRRHDVQFPEMLTLPCSTRNCMFEFGGSEHDRGLAMLIAKPSGCPNAGSALHKRRYNELHATIRVWPGSYVAIAAHEKGRVNAAIYIVDEIIKKSSPEEAYSSTVSMNFDDVKLRLVCSANDVSRNNTDWYQDIARNPGIPGLVMALFNKLFTYRCVTPTYIEPFSRVTPDIFDVIIPRMVQCLDDSLVNTSTTETVSFSASNDLNNNSFAEYHKQLVDYATKLSQTNEFVYTLFRHYIDKDDGSLMTETSFVIANDSVVEDLHLAKKVFLYRHRIDEGRTREVDNFMSYYDPSYKKILFNHTVLEKLLQEIEESQKGDVLCFGKFILCTFKWIRQETQNVTTSETE